MREIKNTNSESSKKGKLVSAALIVTGLTFASKLFTFFREQMVAAYYGANIEIDVFNIAYGLTNNLIFLISTAISVGFLPMYIDQREKNGRKSSSDFTSNVLCSYSVISLVIALILILLSFPIAKICAPTYDLENTIKVSRYFKVLSSGIVITSSTNILTSLLNAEKKYGYGSLCAILLSILEILFMVLLQPILGIWALVLSIPIAYVIQLVFLSIRTREFLKFRFQLHFDSAIKKLAKLSLPIFISQSIVEVNQLVDRLLSSTLKAGSVSALSYGATVSRVIDSLFATVFSTLLYTELSESYIHKDTERISKMLQKSISVICYFLLPVTLITILCSKQIVAIVYGRGAFDRNAVELTSIVLSAYCSTWIFNAIISIVTNLFYASTNTKLAMKISIISIVINTVLSIILKNLIGFAGIVVGTVIATIIQFLLDMYYLKKEVPRMKFSILYKNLIKISIATVISGACGFVIYKLLDGKHVAIIFIVVAIVTLTMYLVITAILKCSEIKYVKLGINKLKNELHKK